MLYHVFELVRDKSLAYNVFGDVSTVGVIRPNSAASELERAYFSPVDPIRGVEWDDTILIGNTLELSLDTEQLVQPRIYKSLEYIKSNGEFHFFEKLYYEVSEGRLIPFKLVYFVNGQKRSVVSIPNIGRLIHRWTPLVSNTTLYNPRLELFMGLSLADNPFGNVERSCIEDVSKILSMKKGLDRTAACDLSPTNVSMDIQSITETVFQPIHKRRDIVPYLVNAIIPYIPEPHIEMVFANETDTSVNELFRYISAQPPIDVSIVGPLPASESNRDRSPKGLADIADALDKTNITDFDLIFSVDSASGGTSIFRVIGFYDRYYAFHTRQSVSEDFYNITQAMRLSSWSLRLDGTRPVNYVRVRKTFNEEATIDVLENPEFPDKHTRRIHLDLALMSVCTYGVSPNSLNSFMYGENVPIVRL